MCHCFEAQEVGRQVGGVTIVLTVAYAWWRWARPTARPLLRLYAGLGSAVTVAVMTLQTYHLDWLTYALIRNNVALQSALFVAGCLVAEVALEMVPVRRLARARAWHQKRRESPATAPPSPVGTM